MKPACPPPPPPVHRPVAPPPPPPTKTIEIKPKTVPPAPPQRDPMTRISTIVADEVESKMSEDLENDAKYLPPEVRGGEPRNFSLIKIYLVMSLIQNIHSLTIYGYLINEGRFGTLEPKNNQINIISRLKFAYSTFIELFHIS